MPHEPRQGAPAPAMMLAGWLLLATAISGCSQEQRPAGEPLAGDGSGGAPRVVRISQGSDVLTMDPYHDNESATFSVQRNIFDALTDYDQNIRIQACLAERWERDAPTSWIFHLRRGVRFHDGQAFTAEDAVYSILRARDWPKSRMQPEIQTIEHVEAIDDHTLRIRTKVPDAILPLRLASILILNREWTEAGLAENGDGWLASTANGTGPYRLELWRKDDRCVLAANEQYWGGAPEIDKLEFSPTSNEATRMAALKRGENQIMVNMPPRNVDAFRADPRYTIVERPSLRLIYLGLDTTREPSPGIIDRPDNPLRDVRVRRAIALGIDNQLIVRAIMAGHAEPADQLVPEGVIGYDPSIRLERPDYDRARQLLAEAGYPDGFKVRLDGPNDRYINDEQIMQAVAQELARIGVTVEVNAQPKSRFFLGDRQGDFSFFLIGWANTNGDGVGTFEHLLHTPRPEASLGNSNVSTNYSNARVDEIVRLAASEFDAAKREALLQEANRIAMHDLPHVPLHFQMDIYAIANELEWNPRRDTQVRGIDIRWKR